MSNKYSSIVHFPVYCGPIGVHIQQAHVPHSEAADGCYVAVTDYCVYNCVMTTLALSKN